MDRLKWIRVSFYWMLALCAACALCPAVFGSGPAKSPATNGSSPVPAGMTCSELA